MFKKLLSFSFFFCVCLINALSQYDFHINDSFSFITLTPPPGVYNNSITVEAKIKEGKLYYQYDIDDIENEPIPYEKSLLLKAEKGFIREHTIKFLLEKPNGSVEIFNTTYIIDSTTTHLPSSNKRKVDFPIVTSKYSAPHLIVTNQTELPMSFNKGVKIIFGAKKTDVSADIILKENEKNWFYAHAIQKEGGYSNEFIQQIMVDLRKPQPPQFGTNLWGQEYVQNLEINIKNYDEVETTKYWLKKWKDTDLLKSHPEDFLNEEWKTFNAPLSIKNDSTNDALYSISAVSKSRTGVWSEVNGPFFFKMTTSGKDLQQIFEPSLSEKDLTHDQCFINGKLIEKKAIVIPGQSLKLEFNSKNKDFKIIGKSNSKIITSDNLRTDQSYEILIEDDDEYVFDLFYADGRKISSILMGKYIENKPYPIGIKTQHIEISKEKTIHFYQPLDEEFFYGINSLENDSQELIEFNGAIHCAKKEEHQQTLFIRIINKKNNKAVENLKVIINDNPVVSGIQVLDYSTDAVYNNSITVQVYNENPKSTLWYRAKDARWQRYKNTIQLTPPDSVLSTIELEFKLVDSFNKEYVIPERYQWHFDRRAIFVDINSQEKESNGTEKYPVTSLKKAIQLSSSNNIPLVQIKNRKLTITEPLDIQKNITIQAYNEQEHTELLFSIKSYNHKAYACINIKKGGVLSFRNCSFTSKGSDLFASVKNSKFTLYNSSIIVDGENDFGFIEADNGIIGLQSVDLRLKKNLNSFSLISSTKTKALLNTITIEGKTNNFKGIIIKDQSEMVLQNIKAHIDTTHSMNFIQSHKSKVKIAQLDLAYNANNSLVQPFMISHSNAEFEQIHMKAEANNAFDCKIFNCVASEILIKKTQIFANNYHDIIMLNANTSHIQVEQTLFSSTNIQEFAYSIRVIDSSLLMRSSIIKTQNVAQSINTLATNSHIQYANNSFFNVEVQSKSYNFWINSSFLTSINSIYYAANPLAQTVFAYFVNKDFKAFYPQLYSNIISTKVLLMENRVEIDDAEIESISHTNTITTMNNYFDMSKFNFFIPEFEGLDFFLEQGETYYHDQEKLIPNEDFFGHPFDSDKSNIDIGAVYIKAFNY